MIVIVNVRSKLSECNNQRSLQKKNVLGDFARHSEVRASGDSGSNLILSSADLQLPKYSV